MKRLLVIVLLILVAQLHAQVRIGETEAYAKADHFVKQQIKSGMMHVMLSEEIKSDQTGQTNLFVFAIKPKGYVIVSALNEVLAYSLNSTLPTSDALPDHIAYWFNLYNEQTDYLIQHPNRITKPTKQQRAVEPLLTSIWGQGCFHNEACPVDSSGPCYHVSAGCVAIAMAQIMYYHKQPTKGNGSVSYYCSPYGLLSANFGQTTYDWDEMVDTLQEPNTAVAKLISHCGIGVKMDYGPHLSVANSSNTLTAFRQFFYYPCSMLSGREKYDDASWISMIKEDLDRQHPVLYLGTSRLGGHAFVCDGYDNDGLFHFNFGWDGVADGYYSINDPYGFSEGQSIIHDIYPLVEIPINGDEHGIIYVASDGTGDGSSWEQATNELQLAIHLASMNDCSVWVKEGRYTGNPEHDYAFLILKRCRLYGGFKGDEPFDYDLSQRDFEAHPSILDGNNVQGLIQVNTISENHSVIIDGFTIQNGRASQGGGIQLKCQTHVSNCKFHDNYAISNGGALAQVSPSNSGSIIIEDCAFIGNEARAHGGAVLDLGNTKYLRCRFCNNSSQKDGGGVYCNSYGNPSLFTSCIISNNTARNGGGVATTKQGTSFWNCLINNNSAETGGGCYFKNGANLFNCTIVKNEAQFDYGGVYALQVEQQNEIWNCIIWGNVDSGENIQIGPSDSYSYCAVEGISTGKNNNFKAESDNDGNLPRFYVRFRDADIAAGTIGLGGDWRLQSNSLCINKGKSFVNQPTTDLYGNPRLRHKTIDIGAYESDVATHIITAYYCEDEPYYYQDSILSGLGTYTFLQISNPYDSLLVIQIQTPPPTVFLHETICVNESYDFFGTQLNEPGQYIATEQCVTYMLNLTVTPLESISIEEEICEGEVYDFFGELLQETGHYSAIVDCKQYELGLTVNPAAWAPVFMQETICEGESYDFFGRALQYSGHYSTTIACVSYNLDLTVEPLPEVHCSNDTLVEYGNLVRLSASGADSYLWSTGDTTQYIIVYPVTDQTYSVKGYSRNGCFETRSINVRVNNEPDETILFPNPADNKVEVYIPLVDEVNVFNLFGEHVYHVKANREVVEMNVSAFPSGIYIVHIRQLNNHYYAKLIIQH